MSHLELLDLGKAFGRQAVIDGLSLSMQRGEFLVIFGPSGCGKTVLLRLISGVLTADRGDIRIDGRSIADLGPEHRGIAMAFQNFALYPHMDAFENIASPLRARKTPEGDVRRQVEEVAALLRIDHVLQHVPRQLSNGQKQRTALARSLVRRPAVLLLDDPLRNVDAKIRYEMRLELPRILRAYRTTVLYVTQDYKEAMALGDRVGVLYDGRFQQLDSPAGVYARPANLRISRLFGDPPINLYETRPAADEADRIAVSLGGQRVDGVPATALPDLVDRPCTLGIRPEDVAVTLDRRDGAMPVELEAITPLNVRAVMLLRTADGTEILASCPEDAAAPFGRGNRQVWARIDLSKALFFDGATGARL